VSFANVKNDDCIVEVVEDDNQGPGKLKSNPILNFDNYFPSPSIGNGHKSMDRAEFSEELLCAVRQLEESISQSRRGHFLREIASKLRRILKILHKVFVGNEPIWISCEQFPKILQDFGDTKYSSN